MENANKYHTDSISKLLIIILTLPLLKINTLLKLVTFAKHLHKIERNLNFKRIRQLS